MLSHIQLAGTADLALPWQRRIRRGQRQAFTSHSIGMGCFAQACCSSKQGHSTYSSFQ
jgi:hypothetical protein